MKHITRTINAPLFIIAVTLSIAWPGCTPPQQPAAGDMIPVKAIAVPQNQGWGYEIYVNNRLFIRQNNIPAVSGLHAFSSSEQALKIADIVIAKMKAGKKPLVTAAELKQAGIISGN